MGFVWVYNRIFSDKEDPLWSRGSKETTLQRLFSTFPSGLPGMGLLVLRAATGLLGIMHGALILADHSRTDLEFWATGLTLGGSGALVLLGFLTPVACILLALATLPFAASWLSAPPSGLFPSPLALALLMVTAVALTLLGPGYLSMDCRLFGRREIIIPRIPRNG